MIAAGAVLKMSMFLRCLNVFVYVGLNWLLAVNHTVDLWASG